MDGWDGWDGWVDGWMGWMGWTDRHNQLQYSGQLSNEVFLTRYLLTNTDEKVTSALYWGGFIRPHSKFNLRMPMNNT